MPTPKLAVLASGTGSLFEAMIKKGVPITVLITDRDCRAIAIAKDAGIPSVCIPRKFDLTFDDQEREEYTKQVLQILRGHSIGLVAMAGYMTVFSPHMFAFDAYEGKILNMHPALLPAFKGAHAVEDALAYGVKLTGCTLHWATELLDAGPIIAQRGVAVLDDDTADSLHERIKFVERELYPESLLTMLS